jgi:hypothetical protein
MLYAPLTSPMRTTYPTHLILLALITLTILGEEYKPCSSPSSARKGKVSKMNFTLHEYCDMYLILGACGNQAYAAARAYTERYPACRHPDSNVFWLDDRMRETGNVLSTLPSDSVECALTGHQHSRRWFWIWWHRIHVIVPEELPESWVSNIVLSI